jgi:hypothetical protein
MPEDYKGHQNLLQSALYVEPNFWKEVYHLKYNVSSFRHDGDLLFFLLLHISKGTPGRKIILKSLTLLQTVGFN